MIWPFTEAAQYVAYPPEHKVYLCPECNGTVEAMVPHRLRWRPWMVRHWATFPCGHVHDMDLFADWIEQKT